MKVNARPAAIVAAIATTLLATACGGNKVAEEADAAPEATTSTSAASSPLEASETSAAPKETVTFDDVDVYACQSFVIEMKEPYEWLTDLAATGSGDNFEKGGLEAYQLRGHASLFADQVTNPKLSEAIQTVRTRGERFSDSVDASNTDAGMVSGLIGAMEDAAAVCESGGFVIDWNDQ